MFHETTCPGLPAKWINAWLAAVGATVLDHRICLRWTSGGKIMAVLSADKINPVDALVESWPHKALLDDLPIARNWRNDTQEMKRNVSIDVFRQRVQMARTHPQSWTLSSTMTDLCIDKNGNVEHAPFDPSVPRGITLHDRLISLQEELDISEIRVRDSLMGYATRVEKNGLGFDQTRLGSLSDDSDKWTDPIVETLAFFGLSMFSVRGNGIDQRLDRRANTGKRQRGWRESSSRRNVRRFHWPAWSQPLDSAGIDAVMDVWNPACKSTWERLGIEAGWRTVGFNPTAAADPTRAFGSERL